MPRRREEGDFLAQVVEVAQRYGWLVAHHPDSRKLQGDPGLPDLVLARGGWVIFAELKSERGRVSDDQQRWLDAIGPDIEAECADATSHAAYVWRPADLEGDVLSVLSA